MLRSLLLGALLFTGCVRTEGDSFEASGDPRRIVLPGDFNLYRCEGVFGGNSTDVEWFFKLTNGIFVPVNASDIIDSRDSSGSFIREAFIRVDSKDVSGLTCGLRNHLESSHVFPIDFEDFMQIDPFERNHCKESTKIIMKEWGQTFQGIYWLPHIVTNKEVIIGTPTQGLKLFCFSSDPVKWFIERKLDNFQYRTIASNEYNPCYTAELVLPFLDKSSEQKFQCGPSVEDKGTWVSLKLSPGHHRDVTPDNFNQTQSCVEQLGDVVFGNKTLGWTTAGGGVMSILMMAGMVFLKRQLNQARNSNS